MIYYKSTVCFLVVIKNKFLKTIILKLILKAFIFNNKLEQLLIL